MTRSKQQKQKLVEEKSLNQILPNIDKVAKQVKSLKASLSFEALPTSKPQLDNLISSFNEAKSKLETIEDETESVAKAGQKLLRTGIVLLIQGYRVICDILLEICLLFKAIHHPKRSKNSLLTCRKTRMTFSNCGKITSKQSINRKPTS